MRILKCPKQELLLEYLTIRHELPLLKKIYLEVHCRTCSACESTVQHIRATLQAYFSYSPDITPSLIRVYSRLQTDETLVLKGWKLGEFRAQKEWFFNSGWLFRGAVSIAVASLVLLLLVHRNQDRGIVPLTENQTKSFARLRYENDNQVKVLYVQPELLHTIEFHTSR